MVTVIGDRESDIYEEFDRIPDGRTHLLTRACRDRALVSGGRLFDVTETWPVRHRLALEVRAQPGRPARKAHVAVRFDEVMIKRPANGSDPAAARQLTLRLVEVREVKPPDGVEPLHWRLLTTHDVADAEKAWEIVGWYQARWTIEQLFRVTKSQGLQLEDSQLASADRPSPSQGHAGQARRRRDKSRLYRYTTGTRARRQTSIARLDRLHRARD